MTNTMDRKELEALKPVVAAATLGHGTHSEWCRRAKLGLFHTREDECDCGLYQASVVLNGTARLIETCLAAMDDHERVRDECFAWIATYEEQRQRAEAAEAENARLRAQVEADGHDAAYWRQALRDYVVEVRHPLPMILHCPQCHLQHIDVDDESGLWATERHHRKHLCKPEDGGCGHIWQPATVYTVGVAALDAATTEG